MVIDSWQRGNERQNGDIMETEYSLDPEAEADLADWAEQWEDMGDEEIAVELELMDSDLALASAATLARYGNQYGDGYE